MVEETTPLQQILPSCFATWRAVNGTWKALARRKAEKRSPVWWHSTANQLFDIARTELHAGKYSSQPPSLKHGEGLQPWCRPHDFSIRAILIGYCHSFNIVIQANKGLLGLWISDFPRSCWFIWSCKFTDAFRITFGRVMSFDQETNAVVFWAVLVKRVLKEFVDHLQNDHSVSRGMVVVTSSTRISRFMNSMIPLVQHPIFICA